MQKRKNSQWIKTKIGRGVAGGAMLVLATLAIFVFIFSTEKAQAAPDSTLYFTPASHSAQLNQSFTVDAMIDPGANQVTGVSLHVTFNPAIFRLDSISTAGSPFSVTLLAAAIDNGTGAATIDVAVPPGNPTTPVTAVAKVATFTFYSLSETTGSPIDFTNASYAVAIGETEDVLIARTPANIAVGSEVTYSNPDFANLVADWMETLQSSPADVNTDGIVNSRDLGVMMSHWQP